MTKKVWEVIALLEAEGWRYVRTRGDHLKFYNPLNGNTIIVPGSKRNKDLSIGTYLSVLRQAKLKKGSE